MRPQDPSRDDPPPFCRKVCDGPCRYRRGVHCESIRRTPWSDRGSASTPTRAHASRTVLIVPCSQIGASRTLRALDVRPSLFSRHQCPIANCRASSQRDKCGRIDVELTGSCAGTSITSDKVRSHRREGTESQFRHAACVSELLPVRTFVPSCRGINTEAISWKK